MPKREDAFINPELLKWARESISMDSADAAEHIGVHRDRLADWEDGIERPTIVQLRKISEVYRRPLAAFYLPKPPADFHIPHDFRRLPESKIGRFSPELLTEIRRMQYQREVAIELTEDDERPQDDVVGIARITSGADAVAEQVRQLLGITLAGQTAWKDQYKALNAWRRAIEEHNVLVFHFERVEVAEARGLSVAERPFPFIAMNGQDAPRARVFTMLHEFAHVLIDQGGVCDAIEHRQKHAHGPDVEAFCNNVAGTAMVPTDALATHRIVAAHGKSTRWDDDELAVIAGSFQASREVVLRRLLALGLTSRTFYEEKRAELMKIHRRPAKFGPTVPDRILRRVGHPFARLVIDAYHSRRVTGAELSDYLGGSLKHLDSIESIIEERAGAMAGGAF
jgi:Zn-dependent peptidase ImmA (M78 family)/DNA-binding XRE family transcriptional regulator